MSDAISQARLQNAMKTPAIALVLGFAIPGAGQMYAGSVVWGIINLILFTVFAVTVIGIPVSVIVWLVSMVLGYKGTLSYNERFLNKAESEGQ